MKNAGIEKLKVVATNNNYSEQDVVYFLVESYKFLERSKDLKKYPVIRFYRNWVCHSALTTEAAKIFEEIYVVISAEKYLSFPAPEEGEAPGFMALVNSTYKKEIENYFFPKLEKEIVRFGSENLNGQSPAWETFRRQLYNVLLDTPLIVSRAEKEIFRMELQKLEEGARFDSVTVKIQYPQGSQTTRSSDIFFSIMK